MYAPAHFTETDAAEIDRLWTAHPLAVLVAMTEDGLLANHIPLLRDGADFLGHVALANDMHRRIGADTPVVAIFNAIDGYVSPNWYPSKAETHKAVPTWNYQVVHVHGCLTFSYRDGDKRRCVNALTHHFERLTNGDTGWRMGDAPADFLQTMLDGIVAFRLRVTRIEAKSKLSQNRTAADFQGVVRHLDAQGSTVLAQAMLRGHKT
ncbi:MAG: FMN-binding negative transcriptional regulator [Rhodobacteraceae bacterium]|jgi:transcriptional regulator|nr:FMN-binding negative transcriptional regulator [Paracoccaceae bacterium]